MLGTDNDSDLGEHCVYVTHTSTVLLLMRCCLRSTCSSIDTLQGLLLCLHILLTLKRRRIRARVCLFVTISEIPSVSLVDT